MKKVKRSFKLKSKLAFTTLNVEAKTPYLFLFLSLFLSLSFSHIKVMLEFWELVLNYRRKFHFRNGRNSNCFKLIKRVRCWHFCNSVSSYRSNDGLCIWNIALLLLQISRQLETFTDMTSPPFFFLSNSLFTLWFVVVVEFWDIRKAENEKAIGQMTEIGENSVSNIFQYFQYFGTGTS